MHATPSPPPPSGSSLPLLAYFWAVAVIFGLVCSGVYKYQQIQSDRRVTRARQYAQERSEALHAWLRAWIDEHLPTSTYSQRAALGQEEDCTMCLMTHSRNASGYLEWNHATQCAICLVEFVEGDFLRLLPCRHFFHPQCADEWLSRPDVPDSLRTCPICKAVALSVNDTQATPPPAFPAASSSAHSHVESEHSHTELEHHQHGCDEECACEHEHGACEHDHGAREHEHAHSEAAENAAENAAGGAPRAATAAEVQFQQSLWHGQWVVAPASLPQLVSGRTSSIVFQQSLWNGQWVVAPAIVGVQRVNRRSDGMLSA